MSQSRWRKSEHGSALDNVEDKRKKMEELWLFNQHREQIHLNQGSEETEQNLITWGQCCLCFLGRVKLEVLHLSAWGNRLPNHTRSWQFSNTLQSPLFSVLRVRLGEMWIDNLSFSCYKTYLNVIIKFFFKFDLNASCYYFYSNSPFFTSIANSKNQSLTKQRFSSRIHKDTSTTPSLYAPWTPCEAIYKGKVSTVISLWSSIFSLFFSPTTLGNIQKQNKKKA